MTITKDKVAKMKATYEEAPYKGTPYMNYLRNKNQKQYLNFLRKQVKYLKKNQPTKDNLGMYFSDFINTISSKFVEFYHDPVGNWSHLDDMVYFWHPTVLMLGKDVFEQTQDAINGLENFKKRVANVKKWQTIDKNRAMWIQNQKKNYFSFDVNKLIKMSRKASNLSHLYVVKVNQNETIAHLREATYKDVLVRIQKVIQKYTNKKYMRLVKQINEIDSKLTDIHTACLIATHAHFDMNKKYEEPNACDACGLKDYQQDKDILNHLPTGNASYKFKHNIINLFKITKQTIKNKQCTQTMADKQNKLCLPIYNLMNILRDKNLARLM